MFNYLLIYTLRNMPEILKHQNVFTFSWGPKILSMPKLPFDKTIELVGQA
jgi:hypothetical protein